MKKKNTIHFKRWKGNKQKYEINNFGGMNMATISFDRNIKLDERSAKRVLKILNTKKEILIEDINVEEHLKAGKEILKRLL